MARPPLEVADVFRAHGATWREANAGHVSLAQLKVMSAIETCRTAAPSANVLGTRRALRGLCARTRRLQLLPESALPEVSGRGGAAMARRPRGRAPAGSLLPRRLHPAGRDRRHRVPEQGRRLRPAVPERLRDADHHRRRSEASGRPRRPHRRAPHLGLGADPPSACPRHRSRRRPVAGRVALDRLQAWLLSAGAGAVAPVPPPLPRRARCTCCPAASTASDITVCSPARRGRTISRATDSCSPRRRLRPSPRARPTNRLETSPRRAAAPAAAAGCSSSRRSKARARRGSARRAGSGSTPHDRRRAARPPTSSIAFARGRVPDHDRNALATSTDPDHAPYSRPSLTFARSNPIGAVPPINAIRGFKRHPQPTRPVRDPEIPIASRSDRAPTSPRFPPCEAFGRPPPAARQPSCKGPASETLQHSGPPPMACRMCKMRPQAGIRTWSWSAGTRAENTVSEAAPSVWDRLGAICSSL